MDDPGRGSGRVSAGPGGRAFIGVLALAIQSSAALQMTG